MFTNNYSYTKQSNKDFTETIAITKEKLQQQGFWILTEINVKNTLKQKLDVNIEDYVILGACNPPNAYKAIQTEQEIWLMLPCNVIVYQIENTVFVSCILPTIAMGMINNKWLPTIAQNIEDKLKIAIDNILS